MASETVGEEEGEEEEEEEEEEKGEEEENATEEEVEGKEKTVVGKPGWPRGVRMIVFVPENGGSAMVPPLPELPT
jgi:CO dehydrogenase/acetyl-CoA synthase beta subunit